MFNPRVQISIFRLKMYVKAFTFELWLATASAFSGGFSMTISENESTPLVEDILKDLPHENCDVVVASFSLPQGETPLLIKCSKYS